MAIWDAVGQVTSFFSLAAFIAAVAFLLWRQKLKRDERLIDRLPDSERGSRVDAILDRFGVRLDDLPTADRRALAETLIHARADRFRLLVRYSSILVVLGMILTYFAYGRQSLASPSPVISPEEQPQIERPVLRTGERIGRYEIVAQQALTVVTTESRRTPEYNCHAPHCESERQVQRFALDEPNAEIIPASVRFHTTYSVSGDVSITNVSSRGFSINLHCKSYGCGPLWSGTRGQIKGYATFDVLVKNEQVDDAVISDGVIRARESQRVTIPSEIEVFSIIVEPERGETEVLTPGERGRLIRTEYNADTRILVIHSLESD